MTVLTLHYNKSHAVEVVSQTKIIKDESFCSYVMNIK